MKIRLFHLRKSNLNKNINYNRPLTIKIPSNMLLTKPSTLDGNLEKITSLIAQRLEKINKRYQALITQLQNISKKTNNNL